MTKSLLAQRSFCVSNSHKSKKNETTAKMGKRIKKKREREKKMYGLEEKKCGKGETCCTP